MKMKNITLIFSVVSIALIYFCIILVNTKSNAEYGVVDMDSIAYSENYTQILNQSTNLEEFTINKVDQYGNPVKGAVFDVYDSGYGKVNMEMTYYKDATGYSSYSSGTDTLTYYKPCRLEVNSNLSYYTTSYATFLIDFPDNLTVDYDLSIIASQSESSSNTEIEFMGIVSNSSSIPTQLDESADTFFRTKKVSGVQQYNAEIQGGKDCYLHLIYKEPTNYNNTGEMIIELITLKRKTYSTDENGQAKLNLPLNKSVYIKEIATPTNYEKSDVILSHTMRAYYENQISVKNQNLGYMLTINKTDQYNNPIEGAVLGIYSDESCLNEIVSIKTDKSGQAKAYSLMEPTVYIKDISVPEEYFIKNDVIKYTSELYPNGIINTSNDIAELVITKVDNKGNPIEGVEFIISPDESAEYGDISISASKLDSVECNGSDLVEGNSLCVLPGFKSFYGNGGRRDGAYANFIIDLSDEENYQNFTLTVKGKFGSNNSFSYRSGCCCNPGCYWAGTSSYGKLSSYGIFAESDVSGEFVMNISGGKEYNLEFICETPGLGEDEWSNYSGDELDIESITLERKRYITDSNGQIKITVPANEYMYLKEMSVPEGYVKSDEITKVLVDKAKTEVNIVNQLKGINVYHYLKGTTNKVAETEYIKPNLGEKYVTSPKTDIQYLHIALDENGNEVLPENATGVFNDDVINVYYYYEPDEIELTIKHYQEGTEKELASEQIIKIPIKFAQVSDGIYIADTTFKYDLSENEDYKKLMEEYNHASVSSSIKDTIDLSEILESTDDFEITYYYNNKYSIKTEVLEHTETLEDGTVVEIKGGTIDGMNEDFYEEIISGGSNKKSITITPDNGYKIKTITINGEEVDISTLKVDGKKFVIEKGYFTDVVKDQKIIVEFEKNIVTEDNTNDKDENTNNKDENTNIDKENVVNNNTLNNQVNNQVTNQVTNQEQTNNNSSEDNKEDDVIINNIKENIIEPIIDNIKTGDNIVIYVIILGASILLAIGIKQKNSKTENEKINTKKTKNNKK